MGSRRGWVERLLQIWNRPLKGDWRSGPLSLVLKLAVVVTSILFSLFVGEIVVRIHRGELLSIDSARHGAAELLADARAVYDPELGYVPKPGKHVSGFTSTIGINGLRKNGSMQVASRPTILAVGDSYTFGDQVEDHETWPAHLETRMMQSVLNGGVFGYGVDQTILRAESLLKDYNPKILIVSMIADDLKRSELAYRYAWKPYFEVIEGKLEIRNIPVPSLPPPIRYRWIRNSLSYSHLADAVFRRIAPTWWYLEGSEQKVHDQGTEVASLLMYRLAEIVRGREIRVIVVAQCDRSFDTESLVPVLWHASKAGLEVLDLASPLAKLIEAEPTLEEEFFLGPFGGHMTSQGNDWIAEQIFVRLVQDN